MLVLQINQEGDLLGKIENWKVCRILLMAGKQLFWILPQKIDMKIITWNIRGMNSIHKMDIVRNFVREKRPNFLLIQETKMSKEKAEQIKAFKNYSINGNSSEGVSGGTLMLWKINYSGTVLFSSKYLMISKITNVD